MKSHLYFHWKNPGAVSKFSTGVSLHGHTLHSRESLDFIPRFAARVPALHREVVRLTGVFERHHGHPLNFDHGWWTPPLGAVAATALESAQIAALGLQPIVSLTDHDNLDAHRLSPSASVELTVPVGPAFLHIGIHHLPQARAAEVFQYASHPAALMAWLSQFQETLVVLNHPLWDESGVGIARHRALVERFLALHGRDIHALELNGLRPWTENRAVIEMAQAWDRPVISGGDRHGIEPNANINVTRATNWSGFVEQIRYARESHVLFLPQYRKPYRLRIMGNLIDILQDHPDHSLGWTHWSDRAFYAAPGSGPRSLASYWPNGEPAIIRAFLLSLLLMRTSGNLPPLRMASNWLRECEP